MPAIDKEIFLQNLLLTQVYCNLQLIDSNKNEAEIFRSFNPFYGYGRLFQWENNRSYHTAQWSIEPWDIEFRSMLFNDQLDHKRKSVGQNFDLKIPKGKILISEVDLTVMDGASEDVSNGLIDGYDLPPIDTWFYRAYDDRNNLQLFAWIPEEYVALANEAILVNCMGCIHWFEEFYPKEYAMLNHDIFNLGTDEAISQLKS